MKKSKQLDKTTSENNDDRSAVQVELDALMGYLSKTQEQCIAKAEAYSERVRRRDAEIAGLKQALGVLENEAAFLQRKEGHQKLRGGLRCYEGENGFGLLFISRDMGVQTKAIKTKYSSCAGTALVTYDGVKVPVENLMALGNKGKHGQGFACIMYNFNHEHWFIVAKADADESGLGGDGSAEEDAKI